jgi:hypothetical protein
MIGHTRNAKIRFIIFFFAILLGIMFQKSLAWGLEIHDAIQKGDQSTVKSLLAAKPDLINAKNSKGATPLHIAALFNRKDLAVHLIANGAAVNAKDYTINATPLYVAAQNGHIDIVELLIAKGADVNTKAKGGYTPLYVAAAGGHLGVATLLIATKADVNMNSNDGGSVKYFV